MKPPSLGHYNEYPLRLNLSNALYFEVSIYKEIALFWFDHIAKSSLTRPDETHHIVCCNTKQFRKEPILHGGIRLLNVSPLSHSKYVFYGGFLVFFRKNAPWFQQEHVSSVLECSSHLCGVQGKLKICFSISSFSFRISLNSERTKIFLVTDWKTWTTKCTKATFVSSLITRRVNGESVITFHFVSATVEVGVCYLLLMGLVRGILGRICNITVLGLGKIA